MMLGMLQAKMLRSSYRRGIEVEGSCLLTQKLSWAANITLSKNKLRHDDSIHR